LADARRLGGVPKDRRSRDAGRDLFEQFHPFPAHAVFEIGETGGVASRPRQALDEASADRIGDIHKHDRDGAGRLLQGPYGHAADGQDRIRRERNQFRRLSANGSGLAAGRAIVDLQVSANRPAQLLEALLEHHVSRLCLRIARREWHEHADAPQAIELLRARGERPRRCRAPEKRDEISPLQTISPQAPPLVRGPHCAASYSKCKAPSVGGERVVSCSA
jgi:hypothetical protein